MTKAQLRKQAIVWKLEDSLKAARFEMAAFQDPDKPWPYGQDEFTAKVRQATKEYMDSWVINPLEQAIAELKGEKPVERWEPF